MIHNIFINMLTLITYNLEDAEITRVSKNLGAETIKRPIELAQDNSPEWMAWQHAIKTVNKIHGSFDCFLSLPVTAPLRNQKDVQLCLNGLDENTDVVITITQSFRNPWFNMVCKDATGELRLLLEGDYIRRQDAPLSFDVTTVAYTIRPDFILKNQRIWDGRVRGVEIPRERALDIDTPLDLEIGYETV